MDTDCARLGEALKAARLALRPKRTQEEVATALGVSRATVQNIEQGKPFRRVSPTIRAFAELVGWTADSPERVLAGGAPVLAAPAADAEARGLGVEGLPMTVQDELERDGATVDTEVIRLPDGSSVTVIMKGASRRPTPEERLRNLETWRRTQTMLRELTYPRADDSQ